MEYMGNKEKKPLPAQKGKQGIPPKKADRN